MLFVWGINIGGPHARRVDANVVTHQDPDRECLVNLSHMYYM